MKKIFGWLLIVTLVFSACAKDGKDGKDVVLIVRDFNVPSQTNKWTIVEDGLMGYIHECSVFIREITGDVFDNGAVMCYLVQFIEIGNEQVPIQTPLPYSLPRWDLLYDEEADEDFWYNYSENYTFEVSPGHINFIIKTSDTFGSLGPLDCTFRVVIMR